MQVISRREHVKLGYAPTKTIMEQCGYAEADRNVWTKTIGNVEIKVTYDVENNICWKNDYYFYLTSPAMIDGDLYLSFSDLEKILDVEVASSSSPFGGYEVKEKTFTNWEGTNVISHAGGAVRADNNVTFYTNSKEALTQNYSLGARVFEFDMYLTADDNLAIVHDWHDFGRMDDTPLNTEDWLEHKTGGMGEYGGKFTTMDIDILLDQMIINPDMFVVTDTKSYELTDEETERQFEIIRDEALSRDPELLNRIIPQIYNYDMYYLVKDVYDFPNMIFTRYATQESGEAIIDFCSKHEEFKAITAPCGDDRFEQDNIESLHDKGLKIFFHTIYNYEDAMKCFAIGADGIYSGIYTPRDVFELLYVPNENSSGQE